MATEIDGPDESAPDFEQGAHVSDSTSFLRQWLFAASPLLLDNLDRLVGLKDPDEPYTAPDQEPLTWDTRGKLVRVSDVIMAMHLFVARCQFRSLTHVVKARTSALKELCLETAAAWAAGKALKEILGILLNFFRRVLSAIDAERAQRDSEQAIRRWSIRTQRELKERYLGAGRPARKRSRRYVWTRHEPTRQERARRARSR